MRRLPLLLGLMLPTAALGAGTVKVSAYDWKGRALNAEAFLTFIGRADRKGPPSMKGSGLALSAYDGLSGFLPAKLEDAGGKISLSWEGPARVRLSLPWPVREDGFSTIWLDKGGEGYSDADSFLLNEEIARTQYRAFKDSWNKRAKEWEPIYDPGGKAKKLADKAKEALARAEAATGDEAKRAEAFDKALRAVSEAWQKMIFEHGLQIAHNDKIKEGLRFGLTLDDSFSQSGDDYKWVIEQAARSKANWVRLVFRSNPSDFTYAQPRSYSFYDAVVADLRSKNVRVMGCLLDTAQWPKDLTPEVYAERAKNLAIHFNGQIRSWEVGNEINGDWLGGPKTPLGLDQAFRIYSAAADQIKKVEPSLETVATLYWWDGTAPDERHSLFGWLRAYPKRGFGIHLDVVGVSLWPEDNPVGMAFETIFERLHEALPSQKVMLSSFGYIEKKELAGYWWLEPGDVDGARKDLVILYNAASCAQAQSLCGGFWWQTLDQMLQGNRRATDLFAIYKRSLDQLGR